MRVGERERGVGREGEREGGGMVGGRYGGRGEGSREVREEGGEGRGCGVEQQQTLTNFGQQTLTCALPQSQASLPSLIPLPQTGSPTVVVGSLVRQRPRLKFVSPVWSSALLQLLHWVDAGNPGTAAMMHLWEGSVHVQLSVCVHDKQC